MSRFIVECYENTSQFKNPRVEGNPVIFRSPEDAAWAIAQPNLLVAVLGVEADGPQGAADAAFEIANAPWCPTDLTGFAWPHDKVRSMCSGDVVVVRNAETQDMVGFVCLFVGWHPFSPADLNIAQPANS